MQISNVWCHPWPQTLQIEGFGDLHGLRLLGFSYIADCLPEDCASCDSKRPRSWLSQPPEPPVLSPAFPPSPPPALPSLGAAGPVSRLPPPPSLPFGVGSIWCEIPIDKP